MLSSQGLNLFLSYYLADYENLFLGRYRPKISHPPLTPYTIIVDKGEFVKEEV